MRCAAALSCFLLLVLPGQPARALRFTYHPVADAVGPASLAASGAVQPGDDDRLREALRALPPGARLAGLFLDSPGGDLLEGLRLAATVHAARLQTIVGEGAKCASACFLVFAAGSHLFASPTALVGVHSASYAGLDTPDAQAATVTMARRLSEYDVPDTILGKMVTAHPSQIWWLNRSELESMRVDMNVGQAMPAPVTSDLPPANAARRGLQAIKPGFRLEPAAHGFQIEAPAAGFHVWRPDG